MMNNKTATFSILDRLHIGEEFTGYNLMGAVELSTGKTLYPATALRYLRLYRAATGRQIVNVNKSKSIYQVVS